MSRGDGGAGAFLKSIGGGWKMPSAVWPEPNRGVVAAAVS
jgi:hypothetical protein